MSPQGGAALLNWLTRPERKDAPHTLIVAAHPDDEIIGLGSRLMYFGDACLIVHVTDGAPVDMLDAQRNGFTTREAYARRRLEELSRALTVAGLSLEQTACLQVPDQQAARNMERIAQTMAEMLMDLEPDAIITHPYEGGHPDHDSTAFAVHAASRLMAECVGGAPPIVEMTSYHNRDGYINPYEFLPADSPIHTVELKPVERVRKQHMLAAFASQAETLQYFPVAIERFRTAPEYDFTRPPHEGMLFYEKFDWGTTGEEWRELASSVLNHLGVPCPL